MPSFATMHWLCVLGAAMNGLADARVLLPEEGLDDMRKQPALKHPVLNNTAMVYMKGERHMGTEFLLSTIRNNFELETRGGTHVLLAPASINGVKTPAPSCDPQLHDGTFCCWKHGYPNENCPGEVCYGTSSDGKQKFEIPCTEKMLVTTTRNPYSWMTAMWITPYTCVSCKLRPDASFSEFLRSPFKYFPREFPGGKKLPAPDLTKALKHDHPPLDSHVSIAALWTDKVRSYHAWNGPAIHMCQKDWTNRTYVHETLIEPLRAFGMPRTQESSISSHDILPISSDDGESSKRKGIYTWSGLEATVAMESDDSWMGFYTQSDLDFVNGFLHDEDLAKCGYKRVLKIDEFKSPCFYGDGTKCHNVKTKPEDCPYRNGTSPPCHASAPWQTEEVYFD